VRAQRRWQSCGRCPALNLNPDFASSRARAAEVAELRRREKGAGIEVDWPVDAFMKALALPARRESLATDLQLRLLDLECCQDTAVGGGWFRGVSGGQVKRTSAGARPAAPPPRFRQPMPVVTRRAARLSAPARAPALNAHARCFVSSTGTSCAARPCAPDLGAVAGNSSIACVYDGVMARRGRRLQRSPPFLPSLGCHFASPRAGPGCASRQHEPPRARVHARVRPAAPARRAALESKPAGRAGEALVGPQRVYFLDEITTGLDSATAHQVVSVLRDLAHLENVRAPGPPRAAGPRLLRRALPGSLWGACGAMREGMHAHRRGATRVL